jgi:hypothetical protein
MPAACVEPNFGGLLRRDCRRAFQLLGFQHFAAHCIMPVLLCPPVLSNHVATCDLTSPVPALTRQANASHALCQGAAKVTYSLMFC